MSDMAASDRQLGGRKLATFVQLTLSGLAVGCIYGLVALGFNFAQGAIS